MNKEHLNIEYNGINFKIEREPTESYDLFYNRAWYIVKKEPKTLEQLNEIKKKSLIWKNINFMKMKYDNKIEL
jgi:hypothetical protein